MSNPARLNGKTFPVSLSATYYKLGNTTPICLATTSLLLFPVWVSASPENIQYLTFLAVVAIVGVALTADYHDKEKKIYHFICAYTACALAILWCILDGGFAYALQTFIAFGLLALYKTSSAAFFLEIAATTSVFITLLLKNL